MKKCSKCKQEKELKEFTKNQGYCKICRSEIDKNVRLIKSQYFKDWWVSNRDKKRQYHLNDRNKRHHVHKWRDLLSNTLQQLHTSKFTTTQESLKYSAVELKEHLDKLGMIWEIDHIDHKIPVSWFKEDTPPYIVNDLRNLQPLNGKENRSKLNKFASPIDDSYKILVKSYIKNKYLKENLELFVLLK
jgi:hypothetical protein